MAYTPLRTVGAREVRPGAILTDQAFPHRFMRNASRLRLADVGDLEAEVAAIRQWFRARDAAPFTWFLGPSSTPSGLRDRLVDLGARPDPETEEITALVLDAPPSSGAGPAVREVTTFEDYVAQQELLFEMTDAPGEARAALRERLPAAWEELGTRPGTSRGYLAIVEGEPVAAGTLGLTTTGHGILSGGATRPDARGRGCYAALVRHRWEVARELGLPALLVQASKHSRPILQSLGFGVVAELEVLVDEG